MTPVIGNAQGVHGEVTLITRARSLTKSHPHELINDCRPPAARELRINHKKSWSFNLQLNLKIANFRVHLSALINKLIIDDYVFDLIFKFSKTV